MPRRSHVRYLAPFAIVAFLIALALVVSSSGDSGSGATDATTPAQRDRTPAAEGANAEATPRKRSGPRIYKVQPGDTPSTIAEKTGVSLEQLEQLNPDIDPQQLAPGQRLRLRK